MLDHSLMSDPSRSFQVDRRCNCIEDLVEDFYPMVYRLCLSILDDPDEAEDAVQETFIAACTRLKDFREESSLKTWVFAIAVNACRGLLRKRGRRSRLVEMIGRVQIFFGHNPLPEEVSGAADRSQRLWEAVERLDEKHRLPVLLRYAHDLPCSEIAQVLKISEGTIQSRLHYARKTLAGMLASEGDANECISEVHG
jgi:RNA polymerase sigma-70 factor (ECF subfamily)